MTQFSPFQFDPSKMDPKVLMELSKVVQQLPPHQLNQMQTLMHNMMAGHDVRREMEEFEKNLPAGFREKLASLMGGQMGSGFSPFGSPAHPASSTIEVESVSSNAAPAENMDLHHARLTILQAVSDGRMTPDQAEKLLFPS